MEIIVQTGGLMRHVGWNEGSKMLKDIGFVGVDWNLDALVPRDKLHAGILSRDHFYFKGLDAIKQGVDMQLNALLGAGLQIRQAHAPFPAYLPEVPGLLEYMVEAYQNILPFCHEIGVQDIVVHGIPWFINDPLQPTYEDNYALNMRLYEPLIPVLLQGNTRVCLENLFFGHKGSTMEGVCSNVHEAKTMVDELNAKAGRDVFGFCLDTGHLNLLRKSQSQFLSAMGSRVTALHIHDNDGTRDEHLCPYTGSIDWEDFLLGLKQAGYRGDICFETFNQVAPDKHPKELVPAWLSTIYAVGDYFRSRLQTN